MTARQLCKMYSDELVAEGYRPQIDSDGDVAFRHEGGTYYIIVNDKDECYFQLILPNFWSIDSRDEYVNAVIAAHDVTRGCKVTKVYLRRDGKAVHAVIEMFVRTPQDFRHTFSRSVLALQAGVRLFVDNMRKAAAAA
jgi:hypothetical protein